MKSWKWLRFFECTKKKKGNKNAEIVIDEKDELVLCTIIDDDKELVQEKKEVFKIISNLKH